MRFILTALIFLIIYSCHNEENKTPGFTLKPVEKFHFKSFVDCNMAEAWIGDTFRIFPGKYGEDPLWGNAEELEFGDGRNAIEAFKRNFEDFTDPIMPKNVPPGTPGLHGAVWFETVYQDPKDASGKTLYAVYHNENYPSTLPYDSSTGQGYLDHRWPQGLTGPTSPAAVCRIGIMKSLDGGHSWDNKGLFIEDLQPRMILKPHNTSETFAGGVGDPSAVASGDHLYLFYGEYGYPGVYDSATYDNNKEWSGQCISVARLSLEDLDKPEGKAKRWDGKGFNANWNGIGAPVSSLQISEMDGGGPASSPTGGFHWGPSVSWNTYLNCWVMLMGKVEGTSWKGSSMYISFNMNKDLGAGNNSQQWSKPKLLLDRGPGHIVWYPSLQPTDTKEDIDNKHTCLKLGQEARLFFKDMYKVNGRDTSEYISEYMIRFEK
ncbi:MAG TPA: hypothetical protein VK166_01720 [Chitinophagaceae bacterium]|nr:hypothetical protein [Chitinophagaceae bacterium]